MGRPEGVPDHLKHGMYHQMAHFPERSRRWLSFYVVFVVETPELSADSIVYLTSEKRDWLGGKYLSCAWGLPELVAKKGEIVKKDKPKVRLVY